MAKSSYTRKPCEGCGEEDYREVGRVCRSCETLLNEAREARERQKRQEEKVCAIWHTRNYALPSYYGKGIDSKISSELRDSLYWLVGHLVEPVLQGGWSKDPIRLVRYPNSERGDWMQQVLIHPEAALAVQGLDAAIRSVIQSQYERGFQDGNQLAVGLASGAVSMDQFNEAVTREGGRG